VVGSGVAGLEAARGAALRGHHVVVFERRPDLGGPGSPLRGAGASAGGCNVDCLRDEAVDAGLEIRLGTSADVTTVLAEQPDAAILATGSLLRDVALPSRTPLLDVDALLAGRRNLAAEALVVAGCTVEIATTHLGMGMLIDPTQQPFVLGRLALDGVVQSPNLAWYRLNRPMSSSCETCTPRRSSIEPTSTSSWCRSAAERDESEGRVAKGGARTAGDPHGRRPSSADPARRRSEGARAGAAIEVGRPVSIPAPIAGQESNLVA
jgi:NAD(P)-binding Rossmann-like domain